MRIELNARAAIELDKDALMKLPRSRGDTVICTRGILWVTEDNRPHDIVLQVGERYVSKGAGPVIVNAFQASAFRVAPTESATSWTSHIAHRMSSAFRARAVAKFAAS
ncbi:MAG: DUF2917 domain-containing protein [Burkholderiales bacterium]